MPGTVVGLETIESVKVAESGRLIPGMPILHRIGVTMPGGGPLLLIVPDMLF